MAKSLYGSSQEDKAIWVYIEQHGGVAEKVSFELLNRGRELADEVGWPLVGLLAGSQVHELAKSVIALGADQVLLLDQPSLAHFCVDTYAAAVYQAILSQKPSIFLLGATAGGRDLAGRLAVRLRTGLNADCTDLRLKVDTGILECEVSGYGGGVLALIEMERHRPQMATVRPGVFAAGQGNQGRSGKIMEFAVGLSEIPTAARLVSRVVGEQIDLSAAPVLIAGGRGVDGNFDMLRELADLLDGEVGATRPPVDEGYIERERQIGQTGVVCRPKVAIVCGASGAFHFVVGIQEADLVIAINSDPQAPIFDYADYAVVGDTQQLVPALIEALRDLEASETAGQSELAYG
jgi:electron transfer flavoprotein alpha subunit